MQVPTTALMRSICRLWIHGNWKYGQMRSGPRSECKRYVFGVATGTCLVEVPAGHIQTSGRCSVIRAVSKDRCSDLLDNTWAGTLALPAAVGTQQQRCHGPARVRSKGGAAPRFSAQCGQTRAQNRPGSGMRDGCTRAHLLTSRTWRDWTSGGLTGVVKRTGVEARRRAPNGANFAPREILWITDFCPFPARVTPKLDHLSQNP